MRAVDAGLLAVGGSRVEFAHPLVRSAVYRSATADDRQRVHLALAEATDAETDPDRRAWHRACATLGPGEDVAVELERSAGRAQARGGLAAAAAFLQRAVALTVDPARRVDRALNAAQASLHAGEFDEALRLAAAAEAGALDELQRARVGLVRGHVAFASGLGREAPPLLLAAANRLQAFDPELARETYLDAWGAALFAGRRAAAGTLLEVSQAAKAAAPPAGAPRPSDLLLDGLATLVTEGRAAAAPTLKEAANAFAAEGSAEDNFRWGWLTTVPSNLLWDEESWYAINDRQLRRAREVGRRGAPADRPHRARDPRRVARRLRPGGVGDRRGRRGGGGHGHPPRALRRDAARGSARTRARDDGARRVVGRPGERGRPGDRRAVRPLDRRRSSATGSPATRRR